MKKSKIYNLRSAYYKDEIKKLEKLNLNIMNKANMERIKMNPNTVMNRIDEFIMQLTDKECQLIGDNSRKIEKFRLSLRSMK